MIKKSNKKILIVQRVLTPYRYDLLNQLSPYFHSIRIISSNGESAGAAITADIKGHAENVKVDWLKSLKLSYRGESRSWCFFIYPQSMLRVFGADVLLLEGTTNLINNMYLICLARLLRKKIIWWDAGYSPMVRSARRKKIDKLVSIFVALTHQQIAYSSKAKRYMEEYMSAHNCSVILNTISTKYFHEIRDEVCNSVEAYQIDASNIKLLYVGAIEKRKKVLELIELVKVLNSDIRRYSLTIIGDGDYLSTCKKFVYDNDINTVSFTGRITDNEALKPYYFSSDILVMPGDGGLAIAQALLFGLPCVCTASDGTEHDYIDNERYVLNSFDELESFLVGFMEWYDRKTVSTAIDRLQDTVFVTSLVDVLSK